MIDLDCDWDCDYEIDYDYEHHNAYTWQPCRRGDMAQQPAALPRLGWKKTAIYSLLPAILLFGALELTARVVEIWLPPWQVDYGWGFNPDSRLFVPAQDGSGAMITHPDKLVCFRPQQFMMPKPDKEFRIFIVGESSVYALWVYPELQAEWTRLSAQFQDQRTINIISAGGLSYGSHRLTPIVGEILNYDPDLILFYLGHNEFEELRQLKLAHLRTLPYQRIIYKSALCRFIRDRIASIQVSRLEREKNREILSQKDFDPNLPSAMGYHFTPEEIAGRMDAFRNNLTIMLSLCKERNVPAIMGTIPSNLVDPMVSGKGWIQYWKVKKLFKEGRWQEGAALGRQILSESVRHQSSDLENAIIRDVARQFDVPLVEVEAAVIAAEPHGVPGETLFDDCCHLNHDGRTILVKEYGKAIARFLQAHLP
jgi:lysophospholipase L1-like esterase